MVPTDRSHPIPACIDAIVTCRTQDVEHVCGSLSLLMSDSILSVCVCVCMCVHVFVRACACVCVRVREKDGVSWETKMRFGSWFELKSIVHSTSFSIYVYTSLKKVSSTIVHISVYIQVCICTSDFKKSLTIVHVPVHIQVYICTSVFKKSLTIIHIPVHI